MAFAVPIFREGFIKAGMVCLLREQLLLPMYPETEKIVPPKLCTQGGMMTLAKTSWGFFQLVSMKMVNSTDVFKLHFILKIALIEILWSNLTLEQNSSWIWLSACTPMLALSRVEYSKLALECRQKVRSKNYFAQVSNSTTKFLSVCGFVNWVDTFVQKYNRLR